MNIIEYVAKRKQELDGFANEWLSQNKDDPENWPLFMSRADWVEQEQMTLYEDES
jgi:hypothetical protein